MADTYNLFEKLLPAKWRDVEFPVTRMRVSIAHDLVEHKYWGVDGAHVESTGLAPLRFTFTAPLLNTIAPGTGERWSKGKLYPDQTRKLLVSFGKKERGLLQHPEFGNITCKAERLDIDWDAGRRSGVDAELSFVETLTDDDIAAIETFEIKGSPVKVEEPAKRIDRGRADLKKLLKAKGIELPEFKDDLEGLANKIKAVTDTPTLLSYRFAGKINALVYQAERIQQSAESARSALTWPIVNSAERIKAAAYQFEENLRAVNKTVALFKVPDDTTLAGVARQLPEAKVGDLIRLNPGLMRSPEIARNTVVRYYRA